MSDTDMRHLETALRELEQKVKAQCDMNTQQTMTFAITSFVALRSSLSEKDAEIAHLHEQVETAIRNGNTPRRFLSCNEDQHDCTGCDGSGRGECGAEIEYLPAPSPEIQS